jgi:GNAT superfamily N-acetyltransferase
MPAFAGRPGLVQRHGSGGAFAVEAGPLGLASGGGRPLPEGVRGKMEAALGADFSNVRVHVGPQAERIGAIAFTVGSDIYFAPGRFQPDSVHGQQLLGHELAHVVQQRAGRVKNPLGSGLAVVQDHALEAEADRLGRHAATHRVAAQAKMPSGAAQPSAPVRISAPVGVGPGSYRLTAGAGGRQVGSVMVHARDKGAVEVTDLGVDQSRRGHGIGQMLVASAAKTGLQFGKSKVTLAAQDKGSGHLTRWYKEMGFTQIGVNQRGFPRLESPISRILARSAQPVLQRMESKDPTEFLRFLATPRTYNPVDLQMQKATGEAIDNLLKGQDPGGAICLGGIILPDNLENINEVINSAKLIKIEHAPGVADRQDLVKDNDLKKAIVSVVLWPAAIAGQIEYLKQRSIGVWGWKAVVEVHYYYNRSSGQINFHKDTEGQTLFVNLTYINDEEMLGPEYISKPPRIPDHEENLKKALPGQIFQDFEKVYGQLPDPTHIEATFLPKYGTAAFSDPFLHHTTPHRGPRKIKPENILDYFEDDIMRHKTDGVNSKAYSDLQAIKRNPGNIDTSKIDRTLTLGWRGRLLTMATAQKWQRYTRDDLNKAKIPAVVIEQLIDAYGVSTFQLENKPVYKAYRPDEVGAYTSVSIPNTGPIFPSGKRLAGYRTPIPLKLKRRMSQDWSNLHRQYPWLSGYRPDIKRCFFRVWIRLVRADTPWLVRAEASSGAPQKKTINSIPKKKTS